MKIQMAAVQELDVIILDFIAFFQGRRVQSKDFTYNEEIISKITGKKYALIATINHPSPPFYCS